VTFRCKCGQDRHARHQPRSSAWSPASRPRGLNRAVGGRSGDDRHVRRRAAASEDAQRSVRDAVCCRCADRADAQCARGRGPPRTSRSASLKRIWSRRRRRPAGHSAHRRCCSRAGTCAAREVIDRLPATPAGVPLNSARRGSKLQRARHRLHPGITGAPRAWRLAKHARSRWRTRSPRSGGRWPVASASARPRCMCPTRCAKTSEQVSRPAILLRGFPDVQPCSRDTSASANTPVLALPPRSAVSRSFASSVARIATRRRCAASSSPR
jgi:hypothetical protein